MKKLRFDFAVKPTADGKSNTICITSIGTPDGRTFGIPYEYQPVSWHKEIMKTNHYSKIKSVLTKRHQTRKIWITLTEDISRTYLDTELNLQFNDGYLEEEENIEKKTNITESISNDSDQRLKEHKQIRFKIHNLGTVAKEFVIGKFTGENSNVKQWIETFNEECNRFQINEDREKIEIIRYFLIPSRIIARVCNKKRKIITRGGYRH